MDPIVEIEGVTKNYRLGRVLVPALRDVSLKVPRGAFLAVAGPSGSGKTTLLNLIGCVDTPCTGRVRVAGSDTSELGERELTRLRLHTVGFIFQSFNLVPVLSVYRNIELPLLLQGNHSSRERAARVGALLERVGLGTHAKHRPTELSGGQRQRVAIARALVTRPSLVLADEPTANLDSQTGQSIIELMHELNQAKHTTFVFSTHDPRVMACASSVVRLGDGKIGASAAEPSARASGTMQLAVGAL
jgi:putative ABC transport system ATP-binding protein